MTDPLERPLAPEATSRAPERGFDLSPAGRLLLAVCSGAAGAMHLAMVPSHMDSSTAEGIGFAVAGWLQLAMALTLLARPGRVLLRAVMVANVGFLGVWAISRTYGLPFGEHAGHPHEVAFVDLTCVGIEALLVVLAATALVRPGLARDWDAARLTAAAVVPVAVLALATAALASPSARDHAHSSHAEGAEDAAGSDHVHGAGAVSVDDEGLSELENGHQHAFGEVELDAPTRAALSQELNETSTLVAKYPTIAAAEAAGYRRAGPFTPGLGTHYIGLGSRDMADDTMQGVDGPMYPALIYDGTSPESPLAGFMFLSFKDERDGEPEGFIGPNDHWHYHTNACVVRRDGVIEAPFGADTDVDVRQCRSVGGTLITQTTYMVHVWTVPGYESSRGVFGEINPKLTCPDGTYYRVPLRKIGFRLNACKSAAA